MKSVLSTGDPGAELWCGAAPGSALLPCGRCPLGTRAEGAGAAFPSPLMRFLTLPGSVVSVPRSSPLGDCHRSQVPASNIIGFPSR